jgi:hypothetical protein
MLPVALGAAGAILGGIAGAQGDKSSQSMQVNVAPETALEKQINPALGQNFSALQDLINAGPGQQDVTNSLNSQRALADLLKQLQQTGGMPTAQDTQFANQYTNDIFAPQQMQMQQAFQDQQRMGNRQAAMMGRGPGDPILLNKLAQEQTRQQQMLGSQMTAFRSEQAMGMGDRRLNFANQLAQVNGGLATQAMQNRQALMSMGSQLKGQDQNFRLGTASKDVTSSSGGGMMGALSGALSGAGAFAGAAPGLASMFSGFGSSGASTNSGGGVGAMSPGVSHGPARMTNGF